MVFHLSFSGVALQVFYFARILIMLHRPAMPGFKSYLKVQVSIILLSSALTGTKVPWKHP